MTHWIQGRSARLAGWLFAALVLAGPVQAAGRPKPVAAPPVPAAPSRTEPGLGVVGGRFAAALAEALRSDGADTGKAGVVTFALPAGAEGPKALAAWLARQRLDAVVMVLDADDTSPAASEPGSAAAREVLRAAEAERLRALASAVRAAHVRLVWVGLPIVDDEALLPAVVALNEGARDAAAAAGGRFVDSWNAFADEAGRYSATGPDAKGRIVRLRKADGVSLTPEGALKLASFVEPALKPAETDATAGADATAMVLPVQPDFDTALDVDINAQIRREAGLPAVPGAPGRSERGPLIALTAPPLAADGRLREPAAASAPVLGTGATLAERVLVEGQPVQPRAGRIDDFSWPRP